MSNKTPAKSVPENAIAEFDRIITWIANTTSRITFPSTDRNRSAAACLAIAQEHHESILRLAHLELYATSFALLRIAFEAYVRGTWLSLCATDKQVEEFIALGEPPNLKDLLLKIDAHEMFSNSPLSDYRVRHYKRLCGYTHTGGHQIMRWDQTIAIEPNYPVEEILELIVTSESISLLSLLGIISMADDSEIAHATIVEFERVRDQIFTLRNQSEFNQPQKTR